LCYVNQVENVENPKTVTPSFEDIPTSSPEPMQTVQIISPNVDTMQEQLEKIEQELKEDSVNPKFYHQGANKDEKFLIYSTELM